MKTKFYHFKSKRPLGYWLLAILICSAGAFNVNAQVIKTTKCLPPDTSEYAAQYHQTYNGVNTYNLDNTIHLGFSNCRLPPDSLGITTFHNFSSHVNATVRVNSGLPTPVNAPAQVNVRVTKTGQGGNQETFQTEMLQLDLQGGSLPAGFRIRESPTLQSLGQTTIQSVGDGNSYLINSFFDIFTELSTDGGLSWIPSSGPGHVVLRPSTAAIPTLSQWGLIVLALLLLSMGIVLARKKELAVSGFENANVTNYFLFDKKVYIRVLALVLVIAAVSLVIARFYYGMISMTDIFGMVVSSFIVSYTIHIFIGNKKKD